jgi:XTP/dITP diphosphohydrolase
LRKKAMMKLLIASQNEHKIAELKPLLEKAGFDVTDAHTHTLEEPEETEKSFIANARIKAEAAVKATGMAVLADDAGLNINALGDFPGVDTKPYSDSMGGYPQAVADIFQRLNGKPSDCHYYAVLILRFPDGREIIGEGRVDGRLINERRGDGTFGYDPWFEEKETGKTFAEMSIAEKNGSSHRSRALQDLLKKIEGMRELRAVS